MAFNLPPSTQNTAAPAADAPQERPPAQKWVNVGYYDLIDGEEVFISLIGIPFENLKKIGGTGALSVKKRNLRHLADAAFDDLLPGEAEDVAELVVQFRRVHSEEELEAADAEAQSLTRLTFGRRKAA